MRGATRSVFNSSAEDGRDTRKRGVPRAGAKPTSSADHVYDDRSVERSQASTVSVFDSQSALLNALPLTKRWTPGIASIAYDSLSGRGTNSSSQPKDPNDGSAETPTNSLLGSSNQPRPVTVSVFSGLNTRNGSSSLWDAAPSCEVRSSTNGNSDTDGTSARSSSVAAHRQQISATPVRHRKAHINNPGGRRLDGMSSQSRDPESFSEEVDDEPLSTQMWRRRKSMEMLSNASVSSSSRFGASTREVALRSPPNHEYSKGWLPNATASNGLNDSEDVADSGWPVRGALFGDSNETYDDSSILKTTGNGGSAPGKDWTHAQRQQITRLVLSRPLSSGLPIAKVIGVVHQAMVRLDRLHGGNSYSAHWRNGTPSSDAVNIVDRLLADQQTAPDADAFPNVQTLRLPTDTQRKDDIKDNPRFDEIDERDAHRNAANSNHFSLFDDSESDSGYVAMYGTDEPLTSKAPVMAGAAFSPDELASHATRTRRDVILTRPSFSSDSKTVYAFVTFGADVFHGSGRSVAMVPRAWEYTGVTHSAAEADMHAARVPFRWFIAPLAAVSRLPRATPFTFSFPTEWGEDYGLLMYLETHNRNALFPLDTLFALGIASAHIVQIGPPTTASLKLDLNPDRALDYMATIEPTLVNRYRAQHQTGGTSQKPPTSASRSSDAPHDRSKNTFILDEGVSWVLGVEYTHGDIDDVAPLRTTVLQEFVLPRGSGTAQWSTAQLYDMLNPANLYREP